MSENFRPKMQNLRPETPILGTFMVNIEILNTHNMCMPCRKFAAVGRKLAEGSRLTEHALTVGPARSIFGRPNRYHCSHWHLAR